MTGVSVDMGPSAGIDPFKMAFEGGASFMARLQELGQKKDEYDAALAALNLGKSAVDAYAEADRQRKEAAGKLSEANATLEQAKLQAAALVAKAKEDAAAILAQGQSDANAARNAAAQVKWDADGYSERTRASADDAMVRATVTEAAAAGKQQEAAAALESHRKARVQADQAKADADTIRARFEQKIADLHAAMEKARDI